MAIVQCIFHSVPVSFTSRFVEIVLLHYLCVWCSIKQQQWKSCELSQMWNHYNIFVLPNKMFVKKNGKREAGKISKHNCSKAWQNRHIKQYSNTGRSLGKACFCTKTRQYKTRVCLGFREQIPASDGVCLIIDGSNYLFIHLSSFLCLPTLPFESENKGNLAGRKDEGWSRFI